jgi:hypothetical protein
MSPGWKPLGSNVSLIVAGVLGLVVTFSAGWALGGATGSETEDSTLAGAGQSGPEVASTKPVAQPPSWLLTQPQPNDLPTGSSTLKGAGTDDPATGITAVLPLAKKAAKPPIKAFTCPKATVRVATTEELTEALGAARPGTVIGVAPGTYTGEFAATRSGTAKKPIYLCGGRAAVLDAGAVKGGYALHLNGASWWRVKGLTLQNAQKGVMLDGVTGVALQGLRIDQIGDEAVHLRRNSSKNVVRGLTIGHTGLRKPKFGEGVYIGTAESNWCEITKCEQDHSNGNFVLDNVFEATSAEAIDIKEGTSGGVVAGNRFDGESITGADSWVDVKGNGWLIADNAGVNAPEDGYQVHEIVDGFGYRNLFINNDSTVDAAGHAIKVTKTHSGNVVRCNNTATGAAEGLSTIPCS